MPLSGNDKRFIRVVAGPTLSDLAPDQDDLENAVAFKSVSDAEGAAGFYIATSQGVYEAVPRVLTRADRVTVAQNTTTESSLFLTTIRAYALGKDRVLRVRLCGAYLNNSGATQTLRVRIKFGGQTFYNDVSASAATSANERGFDFEILLRNTGGGFNQNVIGGKLHIDATGAATSGAGDLGTDEILSVAAVTSPTAGTVDTTVDQDFEVTVQMSTATATSSVRLDLGIAELL